MIGLARDRRMRRLGAIAVAAGMLGGLPLALEVARAHKGMTTVQRPDRVVGWSGDPLAIPLAALWLGAAVAVVAFAVLAWRHRPGLASALAGGSLAIGAVASFVMEIATVDSHLYASNWLRGAAALVVAVGWTAGIAVAAIALRRFGALLVAASAAAAFVSADLAATVGLISAASGSHQPSVDAALGVQAVAAAWLVVAGAAIALDVRVRFRIHGPGRIAARVLAAIAVLALVAGQISALVPRAEHLGPTIAAQLTGRTAAYTISVGGLERAYRVHRAPSPLARPPLVIVLHSVFGSGFQMEAASGFDSEADRRGWLLAYPDGVLDGWDAFGSTDYWGRHPGADDIAFLSAMVGRLESTDSVDPARIYVTGHSRGAMMTYRVGCELRQPVAAIAPMSGNMATPAGSADVACNPGHPVSLLANHGTADNVIPMAGGHVDIEYSPFADVVAKWRQIDGCAGSASARTEGRDTFTTWTCAGGSSVETWIVDGGCHCIPAGAARRLFDFFEAHPLVARL